MHCWPRYLLWLVIALLGTGQMLAACGQKGPLYLPDQPPASVEPTASEVPAVPAAEQAEADAPEAER